ncbi:RhuM family protein [Colwellia sp. MB02u-9]|uniref:RhuM family protein n=1 Tax=Colwellia sp. MB02u-9 TaxID=2759823 RepID=UPI0015F6928E|nr:RhuM family protein [Colwellia sp. MB02u-9]MBA6296713.1 virulence RhuM family protein [Colwellia sp. MB02u-9]
MFENKDIYSPIIYSSSGDDIEVFIKGETVWATQMAIADIFETDIKSISLQIENIFKEKELNEHEHFQTAPSATSTNMVDYYSFDLITSVGYRVDSKKATQFRMWATQVTTQFVKDGFVINEELLRSDPKKLNALAAKIRELRANEKNVYASVRECFKLAASDYEPSSDEVRKFYSLLQDKFHHAITKMTSSKLIIDRANHVEEQMGVNSFKGALPSKSEVLVGKNYLSETEVYRMHLLSEQFLLYAESTSLSGKVMTMLGLHEQLDNLLRLNGYPIFSGYSDFLKDKAVEHATREYEDFIEIKKLKYIGLSVDLEGFYLGEYNEYKAKTSSVSIRELNKALLTLN